MDGPLGLNIFILLLERERERERGCEREQGGKKDYIMIGGRGCYIEGNAAQMLCSACFA
jgi:hypothetical protein